MHACLCLHASLCVCVVTCRCFGMSNYLLVAQCLYVVGTVPASALRFNRYVIVRVNMHVYASVHANAHVSADVQEYIFCMCNM